MLAELWTAIACLKADPKCADFKRFGEGGQGAYVNVVAWADSEEAFSERIKQIASELDCLLEELDEVRLLDDRMEDSESPEELITMRETAWRQQRDIIFGTFHTWAGNDVH